MLIENTMDLSQLGDRMSQDVTAPEEQRAMRDALLEAGYAGTDTRDVPVSVWERFLEMTCNPNPRLNVGQVYAPRSLVLLGWTEGDGTSSEGYGLADYFDADSRYMGPDLHGIEPVVERRY